MSVARIDNQVHCFTAIEALVAHAGDLKADSGVSMICLFDHEEIGSNSTSGAGGPVMKDALRRVTDCLGETDDSRMVSIQRSFQFSADTAHGLHPNYAMKHELKHTPQLNKGTVIKTNDNQRYGKFVMTSR